MHDPMTVAFEIRFPWRAYKASDARNDFERTYRRPFITIWHVDPEKDGTDVSCDWSWRKLAKEEVALADRLIEHEYDHLRTFFSYYVPDTKVVEGEAQGSFEEVCSRQEMKHRIACIFAAYKRNFCWRYSVRWHFWHWKIQVHPLQDFKRWAFSRCCQCGRRFKWGYSPTTNIWDGTGPRWFRSERGVFHGDCQQPDSYTVAIVKK